MELRDGGLDHPAVQALLRLHLSGMADHSPPDSIHALDLSGLTGPDITFWSVWDGDAAVGFGALKMLEPGHGEVKSMRTAPAYLRQGVAAAVLDRIIATARERGYTRLSLETGSGPAFTAAHMLYRRHGFVECGPFGAYRPDPFSRFMSLAL
jgi:putative acetyltransferase